jgi:uncharacterized damage-inducible protein DinB
MKSYYRKFFSAATLLLTAFTCACFAADAPSIAKICDSGIAQAEGEIVGLAEAMPAEKYNFAPSTGDFKGVRTFAQQMSHIATVNYEVAAGVLGEKLAIETGTNENGSVALSTKEAIVKYLKDSFAYAHKAANSLTAAGYTEQVTSPFGGMSSRASLISVPVWHSFDHYGQAVVYARMNGVIPPASRH